jgi:hypothetical protein
VSSNASGLIALGSLTSDLARSNGLEFPNYSARYGQFRVHNMKVTFEPTYPGSSSPLLGAGKHVTMLALGQRGDVNPTASTLLSNPDCKVFSTKDKLTVSCNWRKYLDSHLFSSVNTAVPADQQLKIFYASSTLPTGLLPASDTMFTTVVIFDVEFSQPI